MASEGHPFRGFLYCGLMLTADGPKVIEFNVRFGDPEAQVVLPLIEEPLAPLLLAAAEGRLNAAPWSAAATGSQSCAVGVVLAAKGYPGVVQTGQRIEGLEHLAHEYPDVLAFFAGVGASEGGLVTSGGRVMTPGGPRPLLSGGDRSGLRRGLARAIRGDAVPARHRSQSAHETGGNSALSASSRCPRKVSVLCPSGTST